MTGTTETFTERELEEHFQRRQLARNVMGGASLEAARIVHDIKAHREPEYEPGQIYRDASGDLWLYEPAASDAKPGSWAECPWLKPGSAGAFSFGSPDRPLRKLVPEGSQSARLSYADVLAAIGMGMEHEEDYTQLAARVCKLLEATDEH